ncbi:MAG: hypothetical protein ACK5KL_00835 [Dysgonomonas sp.]
MAEKKGDSNLASNFIGWVIIVLNLLWLYSTIHRFYDQNFGSILYIFLIPNWILIINIICGFVGIFLAAKLIRKKISAWTALPVNFGLFCFCILIECLII